jgi:hypothetical protein
MRKGMKMRMGRLYMMFKIALLSLLFISPVKGFSRPENKPFIVLNNPVSAGFGAIFSTVLAALDLYDQGACVGVKIDLNEGLYLDKDYGPNYWEYFFEPINIGDETVSQHVFSENEVFMLASAGFQISRQRAYELIQKYVHLKPHVKQKIDRFIKKSFKDYFIIGIHHRGTDKNLEAPIVPYANTMMHVSSFISNLPKGTKYRIYVATDDHHFLNYVCHFYPKKVVFNDFVRSKDEYPIHYNDGIYRNNYQKGEEAIIDLLLLARCKVLFYPAFSTFSMTATKFNPFQKIFPLVGH